MSAEEFLSRCQRVKRTGQGRWIASCPAHDDSKPSLNVKEMPDGKILAICRAGCSMQEILDATGLPWSVLFAEADERQYRREAKSAFPAADVLQALADEALIAAIAASNIANGVELTAADKERLMVAYQRIDAARSMVLERR